MVTERFRHLPVADDGKVVGLLDITKCLYDAISKIEGAYEASSGRFSSTIDQLEKELSKSGSFSDGSLFETMRKKLFLPTLKTLIQDGRQVPTVGAAETCKFAAEVMFAQNTSAVMVVDDESQNQQILGIFTSKDLTQRVIAPGLDPAQEPVSQAMTSHPDCASLDTTILDALHLMHDGRYLHLPILNDQGRVVALVDVLELTYGVVNQMGSVQCEATGAQAPIWQNFWSSMLNREEDETSSSISDQLSIDPKICPFAFKLTDLQGHIHRFSSPSSLEVRSPAS
jgi:signal-transduction protein with cAMP-binding, CBS, and nucleotidyltransferase domain